MYVLGEMIKLQPSSNGKQRRKRVKGPLPLPLPWYQRAPLGLLSGTPVFVTIQTDPTKAKRVEDNKLPLGDLVVSVIDPTINVLKVSVRLPEKIGVLKSVFRALHTIFIGNKINIALAEAVTTDCRQYHHIDLVTELLTTPTGDDDAVRQISEEIIAALSGLDDDAVVEVVPQPPLQNIGWINKGVVRHGWVEDCPWMEEIKDRFYFDGLSIEQAIVYSDQDRRHARFVFPKTSAMTVAIEHADIPGALEQLTSHMGEKNLNLLSALLRRGGARHGNAWLLSVCESSETDSISEAIDGISQFIEPKYRVANPKIRGGKRPEPTIYPNHPDDRVIQIPERLRSGVSRIRNELRKGEVAAFVSRRFISDSYRARQIVKIVFETLQNEHILPIEASPSPLDPNPTTAEQVECRLWASDLGIVLIFEIDGEEAFSSNLAHEYGFLHGQDKPVVFLVQRKLLETTRQKLSNIQGLVLLDFADGDEAYDESSARSIRSRLKHWLLGIEPVISHLR